MYDEKMKKELNDFKDTIEKVEFSIFSIRRFIQTYPGLAWIKKYDSNTDKFIMIELSDVYLSLLINDGKKEYLNSSDDEIWPKDVAEEFKKNDLKAMLEGKIRVKERFYSPATKVFGCFEGWKWSFMLNNTVYIAGIGELLSPALDETEFMKRGE